MTTPKKTTITKVAKPKAEKPLWKKKEVFVVDWLRLPTGTKIKAKIKKTIVEGRIFNNSKYEPYVYICQNKMNGSGCPNKLGFKFSWCIDKYAEDVTDIIHIELDPDFVAPKTFMIGDDFVIFEKGRITVGCQKIANSLVREIAANLQD